MGHEQGYERATNTRSTRSNTRSRTHVRQPTGGRTHVRTNTRSITIPTGPGPAPGQPTLTPSQLKTFQAGLIEVYRNNVNRTCWPNRFAIPESDYNGLASQSSPDFPIKSTLELLEEAFKLITRQNDFKILPLAYADGPYHAGVTSLVNTQVYSLYRADDKSLNMNVPLPYTTTVANSIDNFGFQNVGFGQFTGTLLLRPLELIYFTFPTPSPFV